MKKFLAMLLLVAILASCTLVAFADVYKIKGNADVYKKAGSKKLNTVIKKGSAVNVIKKGKKWSKVEYDYNGSVGYIRTNKIGKAADSVTIKYASGGKNRSKDDEGEAVSSDVKKVKTTGKVAMRDKASLSGKCVKTIKKGVSLKVKKEAVDGRGISWYKVSYKGKKGWISSTYTNKPKSDTAGE